MTYPDQSDSLFTPATDTKFHRDGSLRYFPGNTVVSMVPPDAPIAGWLGATVESFEACPAAEVYAFLPASSWHMTVMELVLDEVRRRELWSRFLPLDMPLEETDRFFADAVAAVEPPSVIRMRPVLLAAGLGLSLRLAPADDEMAVGLARYRHRLSEVTGVRFPDFNGYVFHITLAYTIRYPDSAAVRALAAVAAKAERSLDAVGVIELPAPSIRFFNDMGSFPTERAGRST